MAMMALQDKCQEEKCLDSNTFVISVLVTT